MNPRDDVGAMLADQLDRLFQREVDSHALSAFESGQGGLPLWPAVAEMGLPAALVRESAGGANLQWRDVLSVWLALGRSAAPLPLGETMIAAAALAASDIAVPSGPLAVATGILALDAHDRISGQDALVAWAPLAVATLVVAERGGRLFLALIPPNEGAQACATLGRIPSARLTLNAVAPVALALAGPGVVAGQGLLPQMAVLRAALIAGSLQTVLEQTVEYANLRVQFGKAIGKQQAIQQSLAELAMQAALAQVAAQFGCRRMDSGDPLAAVHGAAVAKQCTSRAAGVAAGIAHQVFGAIGVTDEHMLHFLTRRLWQWRSEAGSEHAWAEWLGREALKAGGAALWPRLVA